MDSTRITTTRPSLDVVFGELTDAAYHAVVSALTRGDECLFALRDSLVRRSSNQWRCDGIQLDSYPSGQASITGYVESGDLTFSVELAPSNFAESGWRPGDEPRVMSHNAWDICAQIWVAKGSTWQ